MPSGASQRQGPDLNCAGADPAAPRLGIRCYVPARSETMVSDPASHSPAAFMTQSPIELRLSRIEQLFHTLDPTPFPERDLDDDVVEFIVGWAEEWPVESELALVIHLPEVERGKAAATRMHEAVGEFFHRRSQEEERRLRQLFRLGRRSALIGIVFLAICIFASRALAALYTNAFSELVQEGLIIFGWVANWRPAEIFLYEWWPIRRRARLYDRLSRMPVETTFAARPDAS